MASDGSIKISIEIDGKEIEVASKSLDKLEESGNKSGKGIKAAESSVDSLADSSAKASKDVKGAADSVDGLADSGSKASKDLKGADSAIDGIADSSASAAKDVKGTSDSLDGLADSGAKAGKDLKGADSAIDGVSDSSAQAASSVKGVGDSLDGMSDKASEAANSAEKVKQGTDGMGEGSQKASIGMKDLAISLGLVAIASAAFNTLKSSLDSAISRFDTLNTFPKVLESLGVSAEESEAAMSKLSDGIDGLPTTLDDIAGSAQQMYNSFKDIDKTTDTAIALNNALLASGADAEKAKRGTDQYIKALQTGQVTMDTWTTLQETMGIGLTKLAEEFGYVGNSAENDLYQALKSGAVTFDQFNAKLIELGTGTGELAALAKTSSLGIATSLGNLRNAAAKGIADIIKSFNKLSEDVTGKDIAANIDSLKKVVNASFKAIGKAIEATTPTITLFASAITGAIPVVKTLTPAIIGLMAAYGTYTIISKATTAIQASNLVLAAAQASQKALTIATVASTTATASQTGAITASNLVIGILTGRITLATAATIAKTVATYAWGAALRFLAGPVGWIVTGIGLLVTGVIAVVKWFNKSSEEADRLNAETEELSSSVNTLTDSINSNADAHKESIGSIEVNRQKNEELMRTVDELAEKENKSAAEKQLLAGYINELNDSVDGLNLSYNEEANALNMSSEELEKRVQLMAEQERFTEAMERQLEITKEQFEIDSRLDEITEKQKAWRDAVEDKSSTAKNAAEKIAELTEEENNLKVKSDELSEEYDRTMKIIAEATENGVNISVDALQEWIGKNEELLGSMSDTYNEILDITTNSFSKMSEESRATGEEMIENLRHNQQMTADWAENISGLYEYASKNGHEGFMHWLEQTGPDSAAEIAEISNMTDSQLKEYAELMDKGAFDAGENFKTSLGEGMEEAFDAMSDIITNSPATLRESIKAADFESIGIDITDGLSGGIDAGSKDVSDSAKKVADESVKATKGALQSSSPSKVYQAIGGDITDGLVLGIDGGAGKVVQAIQKMFQSVQTDSKQSFDNIVRDHDTAVKDIEKTLNKLPEVAQKAMQNMLSRLRSGSIPQIFLMRSLSVGLLRPFNSLPSQFNSIGLNAMAGLNAGLNSGRGRVMAVARGIANSVASTMKSALRIHSPSRLMRDDIGKMIPAGIALGIKENAQIAFQELEKLSSGMVMTARPEVALGTARMAYQSYSIPSNASSGISKSYNDGNENQSGLINAIKQLASRPTIIEIDGREIVYATVDDMQDALDFKKARNEQF